MVCNEHFIEVSEGAPTKDLSEESMPDDRLSDPWLDHEDLAEEDLKLSTTVRTRW